MNATNKGAAIAGGCPAFSGGGSIPLQGSATVVIFGG